MNIKPFHFKLKKVSAEEQRVLSALFDFLPKTSMREMFHGAILEALYKHLGTETHYLLEAVQQTTFESFCNQLPDPALLIILGIAPRQGKVILELDAHLANLFIEKLLGGTSESLPSPKPLSDTEQGVLQYLLLQVLAHLYRLSQEDARLHFRFEKFVFSPKELKSVSSPDESVAVLNVKMTVGKHDGFIRICFSSPLIEQLYLNVEARGEVRTAERAFLLERLREFGHIQTPLWAEAGSTIITIGDMKNLEVGDVILFDKTELTKTEKGIVGRAILRAGDGTHGGFIADISLAPKKAQCKIVDVYKGEDIL
jgi:flagellar motor switch protein FliM